MRLVSAVLLAALPPTRAALIAADRPIQVILRTDVEARAASAMAER